ncbi:ATP-binding protein [Rhodanobacter denitrificans]|uniref:histidine kinase n=1 Tax=Rhodanobacter denitrificans TaxID=666685 RepID=M4NEB5_9GAMM|nr:MULTISPECIES: ATP-binding protein [Rhodanobacter]AGG87853.1 PAS domain S-box [Rhodanobacter denitrificans]UJJ59468.1 ATP-binding protein [Rhodanobacter denitrificans]UJM87012.1 ATP-binding protein [Rhodanobacter denitrificans]UJM89933.1 ATP-binding protein [Rhodanobacter denitrificans]
MTTRDIMRWRTVGLLLAMLIIVGLPYIVTLQGARDTEQATEWVVRSTEVKSLAYRIAYVVHDSEAATYRLLAGDVNDATRVRAARVGQEVLPLLRQLRRMTRDNPDQQALMGSLASSVNGRVTLMKQALERLRQGNPDGARQSLRDADDLFEMNAQIASFVQIEDNLLLQRQTAAAQQSRNGRIVLSVTALAQLLLLTIIVITSERQIGRRQLAETREGRAVLRSQLILQAVREPIALFDENLNSLLVNNAFSELYGMDPRQRSIPLVQIGKGAWSDGVLLQRLNDVLLRDRELWDHELVQRTVDGIDRHVVINARRLQQQDGGTPALLLTVSDVTTRALAEQQVNELNRQLEGKVAQISDVNRELEAFSYSVSHDLRAPLRHIAGFARKLEQHLGDRIDEKSAHYIEVIAGSAQRMAVLIDDLLVFSRLGRGALRLQAVDMQSLLDEARALAESGVSGRRIVWDVAPLPMVIGDENMLRTVWQNLLGNAVKYTGHCEVARIAVSVRQGRNGDYEFTVSDNGAGFDMQYADKLFGVFQRLHRASEFPGNGIGLANVRRIVARHGGRVWAEAESGRGAHFHFSLPATDAAGTRT